MTTNSDLPWLYRKSPFLFELIVSFGGWMGVDSTFRLYRLRQPIVPNMLEALLMILFALLGLRFQRWRGGERGRLD